MRFSPRIRRLAPLVTLVVPALVVAAIVAVDAARGDGARSPVSWSGSGALPGVGTAPPSAPPPSPTPAACPESGLSVRQGEQEAAMGLRVLQIVVVNCGAATRTVRGHPAVRLLDGDRRPLDVLVSEGSSGIATVPRFDAAPATVTLKPGERATTALLWRNLVTDPSVRATLGEFLEVTVSGGDRPQVIALDGGVDLGNTVKVGVAPWAAYR
ncbi:DUF4232 domain-containing protein [Phytohabitans sp. LJ34]|uniref:DUF4232 domain-containing protein n=1 Tax=Phytohabitans sp. LJ34 TaxID=3452217 RepID=UPI003F8CD02D